MLILITALSSNYVFVILISQTVSCSDYFELLDLMLKMDLDTLTRGKLTGLPASGSDPMLPALQRSPTEPVGAAACCLHCPLHSSSGTDGEVPRHSHLPRDLILWTFSEHTGGTQKGWVWFKGQQLRPPSPRATAGEGEDCRLRHKVCDSSEMRAAVWQQGAWTQFHSFLLLANNFLLDSCPV